MSAVLRWFAASLKRKLVAVLAIMLLAASLLFLSLFVGLYRNQLERSHAEASTQLNRLLQVSLENAMLKHDLDGLREIVRGLGKQDGVRSVMILNGTGEVRFASRGTLLGRRFDRDRDKTCVICHRVAEDAMATTRFMVNENGEEVLRSVNPVSNKSPCVGCHGPIEQNPINGILFVDYDAGSIRKEAAISALMLTGSGCLVLLVTIVGAAFFVQRSVLKPVSELTTVSRSLSQNNLCARVEWTGRDELARLGHTFNEMAERLRKNLSELHRKEAWLQSVIDAVPDGIRVIDEEFTIIKTNRAYCEQVGQRMEDVVGSHCYWSSHRRDTPCPPTYVTCPLHEIGKDGLPVTCRQHFVRSDGSPMHVEITAAPLSVNTGSEQQSFVIEAVRNLDQQVRLSQEQRLSEIGRLATGVAHEIHNPLASARLGLQSILRATDRGPADLEKSAEYLRAVDQEIDRCIDVTKRLLLLSMPPSRHRQLVSLDRAAADVISLLAFEAQRTNVNVHVSWDGENMRVSATEGEMRMLFLNLVQNAFHAMPNGGDLRICGRFSGANIEVDVEDTGTGIRPDFLPNIFDPFYSRRADGVDGTGLGLTISKAIVDRYGGQIRVSSEAGRGARFTVSFPNADLGT